MFFYGFFSGSLEIKGVCIFIVSFRGVVNSQRYFRSHKEKLIVIGVFTLEIECSLEVTHSTSAERCRSSSGVASCSGHARGRPWDGGKRRGWTARGGGGAAQVK